MKILFDHSSPFSLAHGGFQIQIEQTKAALETIGIVVEWLRWWDDQQKGDLIHYFGVPPTAYLNQAESANLPVIMTNLFTETCNRSDAALARQGLLVRLGLKLPFGEGIKQQLYWRTFNKCAHNLVGLTAEATVLDRVYSVPANRISIIPLGLSETYLNSKPKPRNARHLICTGTIVARKNCIPLAEMAHEGSVPILFVGKPYSHQDSYWRDFKKLIDGKWVKYHDHVATEPEMISLLQSACGFVLMSNFENWCLSAHEAVACGLPLLVPDQKWSRERFGKNVCYFPVIGRTQKNIRILKDFYAKAPDLAPPDMKLHSWKSVAVQIKRVYEQVLSDRRHP